MTVYCSHCSTGYLLPDHLLGPRGARVRCPNCGKTFVVLREPAAEPARDSMHEPAVVPLGGETAPLARPADRPAEASPEPPPVATAPVVTAPVSEADETLAREMLDALAGTLGPRLAEARRRGRVLSEFGPDLMRVVDEFRHRAGAPGALLAFRLVLRERWGVDLITGVEG